MRMPIVAAVITAQLAGATPAAAAPHIEHRDGQDRVGTFVGTRFQLPLGAERREAKPQLGLAVGATRHGDGQAAGRVAFGEGVSLNMLARRPELRLAGTPVGDLRLQDGEDEKDGVSTLGWVAIGTVVVAAVAVGGLYYLISESSD